MYYMLRSHNIVAWRKGKVKIIRESTFTVLYGYLSKKSSRSGWDRGWWRRAWPRGDDVPQPGGLCSAVAVAGPPMGADGGLEVQSS